MGARAFLRSLIAAVGVLAAIAVPRAGRPAAPASLKVAATIFPLYDIARHVAGPEAEVVLVVPPGASPHTFEPVPGTVRALAGARVVFAVGHGLDQWMADLASGAGAGRVVQVDRDLPILRPAPGDGGRAGGLDPHYWLAIPNAKAIASTMAAEIERLVQPRAVDVRSRLAAYLGRLDSADAEVRRILADLPERRIATFHDGFRYFAAAYGLEVVAVFEPFPGRQPGPRFLQTFYEQVRAAGVRAVFAEPQLSMDVLRPAARDLGITISVLDPLGGTPGREGYVELMLFNARQVAGAAMHRRPGD